MISTKYKKKVRILKAKAISLHAMEALGGEEI
jgi:hypothetical protein